MTETLETLIKMEAEGFRLFGAIFGETLAYVQIHRKMKELVHIDETEFLVTVTIKPEKYLNEYLTIPLGVRDSEDHPIYKVVELKPEFRKEGK